MIQRFLLCLPISLVTTFAIAHSGVQNEAVMARMMLMEDIAKLTKELGTIAKGERDFDTVRIGEISQSLADHARKIPGSFAGRETDPKSEALPILWENWSDFEAQSLHMSDAARAIAEADTLEAYRSAFMAFGQTCQDCHKDYRLKN